MNNNQNTLKPRLTQFELIALHPDELRKQMRERQRAYRKYRRQQTRKQQTRKQAWGVQDGRCYLCQREIGTDCKGVIDHDHRCCAIGKSCEVCRRGLACQRCNSLIGLAGDDAELLETIAQNLRQAVAAVTQRLADLASD